VFCYLCSQFLRVLEVKNSLLEKHKAKIFTSSTLTN
jgi:hypothetical protein